MSLRNKIIASIAGATALGGSITAVVTHNEGYSEPAYRDSAGVWTWCYGETKGVQPGQRASKEYCDKQLVQSLGEHAKALDGLPMGLPDVVVLGSVDMAYNIGVSGFKNSSMYRALSKKDYKAASAAVLQYKYISQTKKPQNTSGWTLNKRTGKWQYDCSLENNKVCYGLWKRRVWQSKALGNEFKSLQQAVAALPK